MPEHPSRNSSSNRILSRLSREDFALLEPDLEAVELPVRKPLEARKKRIDHVYFIEAGFASVVANGTSKPSIEVGMTAGMLRCSVEGHRERRSANQLRLVEQPPAEVSPAEFREGVEALVDKIARCRPLVVCFNGMGIYQALAQRPVLFFVGFMLTEPLTLPNAGSHPENIVAGPDGNMWFTENGGGRIGRFSPFVGKAKIIKTEPDFFHQYSFFTFTIHEFLKEK